MKKHDCAVGDIRMHMDDKERLYLTKHDMPSLTSCTITRVNFCPICGFKGKSISDSRNLCLLKEKIDIEENTNKKIFYEIDQCLMVVNFLFDTLKNNYKEYDEK